MAIVDNWPFQQVRPSDSEAIQDFLTAFENELDRLDTDIQDLYDQRFIDTATGDELDKLGAEVGVARETGENVDPFRFRILAQKAGTHSNATLEEFSQVLHLLFGDDAEKIDVSTPSGEPTVRLNIPSAVIDDTGLTTAELSTVLNVLVPMGDRLEIVSDDTFTLGESGSKGLGNGELL